MKENIMEMEKYASENNVPIIEKDSIAFIMKYIKKNNIKNVLEIGSAIGYSTILMASSNQDTIVTTIERDETRYMECLKNVKNFLNPNGTIITDNINFHGYVGQSSKLDKGNLKSLVEKIEKYIEFLKTNPEFDTKFYDIGDGLSVSTWKNE